MENIDNKEYENMKLNNCMVINYNEGIIGKFGDIKTYLDEQIKLAYIDNAEWGAELEGQTEDLIASLEENISDNTLIYVEELSMGGLWAKRVEITEVI